jgi:ribosomal-protein-serine acetyltransferase
MFVCPIDEDICLRPFRMGDAEELFQLTMNSRIYLKEWLGWLDYARNVEDTAGFIQSTLQAMIETGGYPRTVAIMYRGQIAGVIGFNEINKSSGFGIVGYWLGKDYQGKGIMSKSLEAFLSYGFKVLELNRIEIRAAPGNLKSRALPERLGFTEEGRIRQAEWLYDHYVDHIIYGLLRAEWEAG